MNTKKCNPKEFKRLLKLHTDESHKAYLKAQKNYLSVLEKFIEQEIATKNDYQERYDSSAACCLDNQWLPNWSCFENPNNEIKVLFGMIGDYEFELWNPEEFEEELN